MSKVQTAGRIAAAAWLAVCVNVGSQRIGEIIGEKVAEGVMKARRRREERWVLIGEVEEQRQILADVFKNKIVQAKADTALIDSAAWALSQRPDRLSLAQLECLKSFMKNTASMGASYLTPKAINED